MCDGAVFVKFFCRVPEKNVIQREFEGNGMDDEKENEEQRKARGGTG